MGIVGLGFMGRRYAQFVSGIEGMKLAGVVDIDSALAERTAAEFGGRVFESVEELAASNHIDGVMVCTPEHLHVDAAVAALRAGKPTMVEKPIAHSLDAARTIADAAAAAGVPLLAGHILRFEQRWMAARQRLDAGAIGDVVSITTRRIGNVLDQEVLKARTSIPLYYGVHDLDIMGWFTGAPAVSMSATRRSGALQAAGYDIDDVYTAVVTFENGVLGTAELGWHVPAEAASARTSGVAIVGTRGFIRIEQAETGFECWTDGGLDRALDVIFWSDAYGIPGGALGMEIRHFADCVRGTCAPTISPDEAIEALRLSLAMEDAATTGTTIDLRTFGRV
jgi:myo-inositol 2-dehydrogenase/D-chiro-inositol 1-dehydrogenase